MPPSSEYHSLIHSDAPVERLKGLGVKSLSNAELLALLLSEWPDADNQTSAYDQARGILADVRSLGNLSGCSLQELMVIHAMTFKQAIQIVAAGELGRRVHRESLAKIVIDDPEAVCQLMVPRYRGLNQESVQVLLLNSKRLLLRIEEIFRGSLRETVSHPREIFKPAILYGADAIVLVHNHPSGDPTPSPQDNEQTNRVVAAGKTLGIEVEDHVIIGSMQAGTPLFYSYKQEKKLH